MNKKMRNIIVNKECIDGMLSTAILETLEELKMLDISNNAPIELQYKVYFKRKNKRKNGKKYIEITTLYDKPIMYFWIKDIYRFNTQQQCKLIPYKRENLK